jgi:hypothetical protein
MSQTHFKCALRKGGKLHSPAEPVTTSGIVYLISIVVMLGALFAYAV